jgi:selenoprotein W-related protein
LTSKLLTELKDNVKQFTLIPGTGGCFEIKVNGELIYSKLKTGQFPDENWVLDTVKKKAK